MYILIDTCIFMDFLFEREPYFKDAKDLFSAILLNKSKIFVAPTTFKDIYYFANKIKKDQVYAQNIIAKIYGICHKVLSITSDDTINALFDSGDFEDNLLIEASKRELLDGIITRNIKDFQGHNFHAWTPREFINITANL